MNNQIKVITKGYGMTGKGWVEVYKGSTRIKSYIYKNLEHREQLVLELNKVLGL